jgi:sterol desaturase/sphingolipid hydroxylase (fatty acid hydroxylase superfamily)
MKYKSIQLFALINISLLSFGSLEYALFYSVPYSYTFLYLSMLFKNVNMAYLLDSINRDKPYIVPRSDTPINVFKRLQSIALVSGVDLLSLYLAITYLCYEADSSIVDSLLFIPQSFLFEVSFDFFHYWFHRLCHTNKFLYKTIHSEHHATSEISVYTTFEQHPVDLLLTNTIPVLASCVLLPPSTYFILVFFWYKSFLEISGHLGKENKGLSFPQFAWLPKYLNISLKTRHHNTHHIRPMRNFGKRFALWDKVFGTFEESCDSRI